MPHDNAQSVDSRGAYVTHIQGNQYNSFHMNNSENGNANHSPALRMINLIVSRKAFEALRRASVVDAQYNSRHRSCPPCDPDTRTDILNNIFEWLHGDNDRSICWLYGIAGSGKSAIAQTVSEHIAEKKLAASLFFNQMERDLCVKEYIIATIAYQLAISIPALKCHICDVITRDEAILRAVFADQLSKLIIEPLKSLSETCPSMVIVIDGLDECKDYGEVAQLMTQLSDPSDPHLHFQFLVTSRPEPFLRAVFEHPTMHPITTQFNLQDFGPDSDIRSFLERRLEEITRVRFEVMSEVSLPWPSSDNLDALVKKSAGLFIYASTLIMFISNQNNLPHKQLETALMHDASPISQGHSDLDRLYTQILSASSNVNHLLLVIGAIILVRMPLSPRALSYLLEIELGNVQLVLEKLHSVLSIPENPDTGVVAPFHLSLHDFLVSPDRAGRYFIDPHSRHTQLAKLCLKRISALPKFTFPPIRHPAGCWDDVVQCLQQADTANRMTIQYACHYWSSHVSESPRKGLTNDLKDFCRHRVFPWRMCMEIEARERNIIQIPENREMLLHDLHVRGRAVRRAAKMRAFKVLLCIAAALLPLSVWILAVSAPIVFHDTHPEAQVSQWLSPLLLLYAYLVARKGFSTWVVTAGLLTLDVLTALELVGQLSNAQYAAVIAMMTLIHIFIIIFWFAVPLVMALVCVHERGAITYVLEVELLIAVCPLFSPTVLR
jgi:hypothetical protein